MAVRFGNIAMFEPLGNIHIRRSHQIPWPKTVGVGGRGEYLRQVGLPCATCAKNHLMQLLCLDCDGTPRGLIPTRERDEKAQGDPRAGPRATAISHCPSWDSIRQSRANEAEQPGYRYRRWLIGAPRTESLCRAENPHQNWRLAGDRPSICAPAKPHWAARSSEITVVVQGNAHSIFTEGCGDVIVNVLSIRLPSRTRALPWPA